MFSTKALLALSTLVPVVVSTTHSTTYSNGTTAAKGACACSQLATAYPDVLYYPDSTNYTTVNLEAWDTRSNLDPTCIFNPTTADAVSAGMAIISGCSAQFAIRGGGHMNFPGANNVNNGVMVALSNLNNMQISADNQTVEVGPGNRWYDVATYLEPYGRIVIGGRMKEIGVPGLTLIGGVHYFINKYGYAMDNVVAYDVVLGNGTFLTASANSSSDLFWALKGGANNFGVVTKFTFKALPVPIVSTTVQEFGPAAVPAFLQATLDLIAAAGSNNSIGAGAIIDITYNATTKVAAPLLIGAQEGTSTPAPSQFANFTEIVDPDVYRVHNVSTLKAFESQLVTGFQTFRVKFAVHALKLDYDTLYEFYQMWIAACDEIADVDGLTATFVLNSDPVSARSVALNNGVGNVWGRDDLEPYVWYQTSTAWNLASDDLRVQTWSRELSNKMHSIAQARNLSSEFLYAGDSGEEQDIWAGMPSENVEKMKTIRTKYDAGGVFTYLNWGGFKLPM